MNRNDIIRMAREAGLERDGYWEFDMNRLEGFAALVAAHERKAMWDILFEYAGREDLSESDQSLLKHLADLIRARSST